LERGNKPHGKHTKDKKSSKKKEKRGEEGLEKAIVNDHIGRNAVTGQLTDCD
jgi:hypothetical protein